MNPEDALRDLERALDACADQHQETDMDYQTSDECITEYLMDDEEEKYTANGVEH